MARIIFERYFYKRNSVLSEDVPVLIADAVSTVYDNGLKYFNPDKQKAYTYFQTIIKNHYHDRFTIKKSQTKFSNTRYKYKLPDHDSIDLVDMEVLDRSVGSFEETDDGLKDLVIDKLRLKYRSRKYDQYQKQLIKHVIDIITIYSNYNKHFTTYMMLTKTGSNLVTLGNQLRSVGLEEFTYVGTFAAYRHLTNYESFVKNHLKECQDDLVQVFNRYADTIKDEKERKKSKKNVKVELLHNDLG